MTEIRPRDKRVEQAIDRLERLLDCLRLGGGGAHTEAVVAELRGILHDLRDQPALPEGSSGGAGHPGREAWLAAASRALAESLDHEVTLATAAGLAVPRLADACVVYVRQEDGSVRPQEVAHADPAAAEALRQWLQRPGGPQHPIPPPVERALRTGEAEILAGDPAAVAHREAEAADGAEFAAGLQPRAQAAVPLQARGRAVGVLHLARGPQGEFTADELWLARELADRAALALDNARLYLQARRASEARMDFVAGLSHEFRTPLTAILAFAEMLAAGIPEPISGVALRHAERIVASAKHLADLIDQVLTLSRIEAGRDRLEVEMVDLAELVRDTVALVEPLARQKQLPLRVEVPRRGPAIRTDPNKVRQVLFNLIGNAVKFTERGEVRVALRPAANRLLIEVHDTGEGIPPEQLDRIWEPFWRAAATSVARPPGTGLGLGIVKHLVHMLGGEVRAGSDPGRGSVFVVELPTDAGAGEGGAAEAGA